MATPRDSSIVLSSACDNIYDSKNEHLLHLKCIHISWWIKVLKCDLIAPLSVLLVNAIHSSNLICGKTHSAQQDNNLMYQTLTLISLSVPSMSSKLTSLQPVGDSGAVETTLRAVTIVKEQLPST